MTTPDPTAGEPEPAGELGPFRIGRRLGVGGMGIVYQALDKQLNRQVALKIIAPHIGDDPEFRARFTREAQAQASLDSPHVVQVYSFGEADGRLYIASQLIPDGDLGQMMQRHGPTPPRIAANLISQVAEGLSDAHAAGLVHRDIKPGNVLLRHRDNALHAYLGDFGIARRQDPEQQLTRAGSQVGTPSYMAPELHTGGEASITTDIYSLGCLLWAALTGKSPFSGGTEYQVIMGHVDGPIPQLAVTGPLSSELNRVLRTAMAKDPAARYPSAAAMRDDLRQVMRLPEDGAVIHAQGESTPSSPQPWQFAPPSTPTPTPSPTPAPAPLAPQFQSQGHTPTPFFQHGYPAAAPPPRSSGKRVGWIVALVLALVTVAVVVAVVLATGDDDNGGGGGGGNGEETKSAIGDGSREDRAIAALTDAFAEGSTDETDRASAACISRYLVDDLGVDKLIEAGVLTEDLEANQNASTDNPSNSAELGGSIVGATFSCIGELAGSEFASPN